MPTWWGSRRCARCRRNFQPTSARRTGWHAVFAPAERLGYSGVALYSREPPTRVETRLGVNEYDIEGRLLIAHFGRLVIATVYFPKGSGTDRDNSRVPYKLGFYRAVFERLQVVRRRGPVYVVGDYNTAHTELDLARPRTNTRTSGFLPEERAEMQRWIDAGWSDTFRRRHRGRSWALHVVATVGQCACGQRRLADRLRAGLPIGPAPRRRRVHLARGDGVGPLPDRRGH